MKRIFYFSAIVITILSLFATPGFCSETVINIDKNSSFAYFSWVKSTKYNETLCLTKWTGSRWTKTENIRETNSLMMSPSITTDKDGKPNILWVENDGIKTSIYSISWTGKKWSEIIQVSEPNVYEETTPYIYCTNNNQIWAIWVGGDGLSDQIFVSHWKNKHWTSPIIINSSDNSPDAYPVLMEDKNNQLIAVWTGYENKKTTLYFSVLNKHEWTSEKKVLQNNIGAGFPTVNYHNHTPVIYWEYKGQQYKSIWNGKNWQEPIKSKLVINKDFYKKFHSFSGVASLCWKNNSILQMMRIPPIFININKSIQTVNNSEGMIFSNIFSRFFDSNLYADTIEHTYIAFGDSITYGYPYGPGNGYPRRLQDKLIANIAPSTVYNEGVEGEKTSEGLNRIDGVLANRNAEYFLLMEGTNDTTAGLSTGHIVHNLREMANRALGFGCKVIIAKLPCREKEREGLDTRTREDVNPAIEAMAIEMGLPYIDPYAALSQDRNAYVYDWVHLTQAGYEVLSQLWYDKILEVRANDDDDDGGSSGCGIVPPVYRKGNYNPNTLNFFILIFFFVILIKRALSLFTR